ncbi:uncharacterized protein LOC128900120 isoform X1 [Rissa tridactyla]|uniref:uncharacterized protein LOC128900120 isoform X1 n=1 Tax=Rissa tridactyla TaxID=75485 RepID=UPI0023BA5D25|nr:uncharacterized protein LOC128900120 isoform X1 [Rissa tridactyla]
MARALLVLLTGVTALLLVGAEGPPAGTPLVGGGGARPGSLGCQRPPDTEDDGLQPSDEDIMSGGGLPPGTVRCALCKRVVKALKGIVVDPKDKGGVARVTHRVCGQLWVGRGLCQRLLSHALARIEAAIKRHETPAHLCAHLRWCPPWP